jgi:hypothetical protein
MDHVMTDGKKATCSKYVLKEKYFVLFDLEYSSWDKSLVNDSFG